MNFDKAAALYVYCSDYHEGQFSREYSILSRLTKRGIKISDSAFRHIRNGSTGDEWFGAHEIYRALVRKYQSL